MAVRKIELMHWYFGKAVGHKCKECSNLITGQYHDMTLRKCAVYGLTHSEASDWALKYDACGMFNKKWNGHPIIRLVKGGSSAEAKAIIDEPLEGQMTFEEINDEV